MASKRASNKLLKEEKKYGEKRNDKADVTATQEGETGSDIDSTVPNLEHLMWKPLKHCRYLKGNRNLIASNCCSSSEFAI